MPWDLTDLGGGWAYRAAKLPNRRVGCDWRKRGTNDARALVCRYVTIYKDGKPVDTAVTVPNAKRRVAKYKSGALPCP